MIDRALVERLTLEYGAEWGLNHTRRLLQTIEVIGEGLDYDREVVWLAAHLHDWGGYQPWAQEGMDHVARSRQVAAEFLAAQGLSPEEARPILDCIASHHSGDPNRSLEAILLSDADALDFLGVVGVLRDFAKAPKDLRAGYKATRSRMEGLPKLILLERSKALMQPKLERMARVLAEFEEETRGLY